MVGHRPRAPFVRNRSQVLSEDSLRLESLYEYCAVASGRVAFQAKQQASGRPNSMDEIGEGLRPFR